MPDIETSVRKKILAISYLFPNSQQPNHGIFVLNRLKALSQYVDIVVINPLPYLPLAAYISDRYAEYAAIPYQETLAGLGVYHPRFFSIPGIAKGLEAKTYTRAVRQVVAQLDFDFDLIDLHWTYPDLPAGVALKAQFNKPLLCTLRGLEAFHRNQGRVRSDYIEQGLKHCDQLIALSSELKQTADGITTKPDKSQVIINGVDTEKFYYLDQASARNHLNLPSVNDEKIILGVGSLIHRKGFDLVIEALPALLKRYPNLKYYILGSEGPEGDYRATLKAKVSALKLEQVVKFQGSVANQQLMHWYNACDLFCLSSRGEGSPNVLSEALACGTPAVSTAVGASADMMAMAGLERYVDGSSDFTNLGSLIEQALQEPSDRQAQATQYRQYSWDWCANKVLDVYKKVLSSGYN